ncbi:MAG: TIM barrel protein [Spirosomataceae bacterium]
MNRRNALKNTALAATFAMANPLASRVEAAEASLPLELKGRINHSTCRWCYQSIPLEDLCKAAKEIGLQSIELTGPDEWPILAKYGLTCAMGQGKYPDKMGLPNFFNKLQNHDALVAFYEDLIPKAANAGLKNVICFSGNRDGMDDYVGLLNCKKGIQRVIKTAEKYKVTLTMELLNSKVDHRDYQCDHTEWGVVLCEMVGSDYFKLLYDIYHMQIMEGDVIATIRKYHQYFSHYHTGGVPGRHEIDETQELNYPAIMKAIVDTGYKGFVAQEFVPSPKDDAGKLASLRKAVQLCDI